MTVHIVLEVPSRAKSIQVVCAPYCAELHSILSFWRNGIRRGHGPFGAPLTLCFRSNLIAFSQAQTNVLQGSASVFLGVFGTWATRWGGIVIITLSLPRRGHLRFSCSSAACNIFYGACSRRLLQVLLCFQGLPCGRLKTLKKTQASAITACGTLLVSAVAPTRQRAKD